LRGRTAHVFFLFFFFYSFSFFFCFFFLPESRPGTGSSDLLTKRQVGDEHPSNGQVMIRGRRVVRPGKTRERYHFASVLRDLTGMPHILPIHQAYAGTSGDLFELVGGLRHGHPQQQPLRQRPAPTSALRGRQAVDLVIDEGSSRGRHTFLQGEPRPGKKRRGVESTRGRARAGFTALHGNAQPARRQPVSPREPAGEARRVCRPPRHPRSSSWPGAGRSYLIKIREAGTAGPQRPMRSARNHVDLAGRLQRSAPRRDGLVKSAAVLMMRDDTRAGVSNAILILMHRRGRHLRRPGRGAPPKRWRRLIECSTRITAIPAAESSVPVEHLLVAGFPDVEDRPGAARHLHRRPRVKTAYPPRVPGRHWSVRHTPRRISARRDRRRQSAARSRQPASRPAADGTRSAWPSPPRSTPEPNRSTP